MSARDDYPRPLDQWQAMMAEIDRLRASIAACRHMHSSSCDGHRCFDHEDRHPGVVA